MGGRREGKAPTRKDRKHQERDCRKDEPQRRVRRSRRVASDPHLEHRRDQQEHDQQVEHVLAREGSDPDHVTNVLQARVRRFLPR